MSDTQKTASHNAKQHNECIAIVPADERPVISDNANAGNAASEIRNNSEIKARSDKPRMKMIVRERDRWRKRPGREEKSIDQLDAPDRANKTPSTRQEFSNHRRRTCTMRRSSRLEYN